MAWDRGGQVVKPVHGLCTEHATTVRPLPGPLPSSWPVPLAPSATLPQNSKGTMPKNQAAALCACSYSFHHHFESWVPLVLPLRP